MMPSSVAGATTNPMAGFTGYDAATLAAAMALGHDSQLAATLLGAGSSGGSSVSSTSQLSISTAVDHQQQQQEQQQQQQNRVLPNNIHTVTYFDESWKVKKAKKNNMRACCQHQKLAAKINYRNEIKEKKYIDYDDFFASNSACQSNT